MATSKQAAQTYPGDYASVFRAVCTAVQAEGMTILMADEAHGLVSASASISWSSWGENINIAVGADPGGGTVVSVQSGLKFGLVDWGRNRKNLDRLFMRIGAVVGAPAPGPAAAAPAGAWHPDPRGRHEFRYWDGSAWTDQVSDEGVVASDPV